MRRCKGEYFDCKERVNKEFEGGYFHWWGVNSDGCEIYSVAIVELLDGRVIVPRAEDISFYDEPIEKRELETSVRLL